MSCSNESKITFGEFIDEVCDIDVHTLNEEEYERLYEEYLQYGG